MARRMADPHFRDQQHEDRRAEHVRPINELVGSLRARGPWVPDVAPHHGGVSARALLLLRSPGSGTHAGTGSGFLSTENDDQTAETMSELLASAHLDAKLVTPWNAYPWFIDGAPSKAQLDSGVDPLIQLIDLLPDLRVVLLHGSDVKDFWQRAVERRPALLRSRPGVSVLWTYSPSRQALFHQDPQVRAERAAHRVAAYAEVAAKVDGGGPSA